MSIRATPLSPEHAEKCVCERGGQVPHVLSPACEDKPPAGYPEDVVLKWRQAARKIARSSQEAEDIAWLTSVSAFFQEGAEE